MKGCEPLRELGPSGDFDVVDERYQNLVVSVQVINGVMTGVQEKEVRDPAQHHGGVTGPRGDGSLKIGEKVQRRAPFKRLSRPR